MNPNHNGNGRRHCCRRGACDVQVKTFKLILLETLFWQFAFSDSKQFFLDAPKIIGLRAYWPGEDRYQWG